MAELFSEKNFKSPIVGHLDINVNHRQEEFEGVVHSWDEVLIHGDPDGLRSFTNMLLKLADLNQEIVSDLPVGAREHYHLRPDIELAGNSVEVIVGRLDAKGTGEFYKRYAAPKKR